MEMLSWLHDVLPELDRIVEPVVAATRLPDVPLYDWAVRPDGPVGEGGRDRWAGRRATPVAEHHRRRGVGEPVRQDHPPQDRRR